MNQPLDEATADYISGGGKLEDIVSYNRFRFYYYVYPMWPKLPGDGLYSYHALSDHAEDLSDYDFALHYNRVDPLYYTPKRIRQLRCKVEFDRQAEEGSLNFLRMTNVAMQSQLYREMACCMSNIQLELNGNLADAIFYSPLFQLEKNRKSRRYVNQIHDVFDYTVNPQRSVLLEVFACLKELGIYHLFDCQDLIDLYSFSMYHPCATVCHGCRQINWVYHQSDHMESEYMMCMTPECKFAARKRDVPSKALLTLPFHGFNLQSFWDLIQERPQKTTLKTLAVGI